MNKSGSLTAVKTMNQMEARRKERLEQARDEIERHYRTQSERVQIVYKTKVELANHEARLEDHRIIQDRANAFRAIGLNPDGSIPV